jgi:5-methylcytosine-specific restriction endonuclease McrA
MIFVQRLPKPSFLIKNEQNLLFEYIKAKKDFDSNTKDNGYKSKKEKAEVKYRHKEVKNQLINMFDGKCAYCESHITHIDYGHIEHFKPKSKFPNECFEYQD